MKLAKVNFLGIKRIKFDEARVIIVPFGLEMTTSYSKGTKRGPEAILKASRQIELFDEELWQETCKIVKITTLKEIKAAKSFALAKKQIGDIIEKILENKKFPIIFGGEHSITPFIIAVYKKMGFNNFSLLQFDAHADLRNSYLGQKHSHAAAMRRCLDFPDINLVQVGIRSISKENNELNFWKENQPRIKTFWAKDKKQWKIKEILENLKENVYLTFDVDVFDSSLMPSTGTPQPGGLNFYEALDILRAVMKNKNIIGADFVELSPIKGFNAPDFLAAKLIYKIIGYLCPSFLKPLFKRELKNNFEKFLASKSELEILTEDEVIFRSRDRGVKGLMKFIIKNNHTYKDLIIFDKKVGRGVALLAIFLGAKMVFGEIGSSLAKEILKKARIDFYFKKIVPNILNKKGNDLCFIEKLSIGKTPAEFYSLLKESENRKK